MNKLITYILSTLIAMLLLSACDRADKVDDRAYRELGWEDLVPYPKNKDDATGSWSEGSGTWIDDNDDWDISQNNMDDSWGGGFGGVYSATPGSQLPSGVVSDLDEASIRIPGFVVPLEFDENNLVTEFFLAPYFGACYHEPPPPPNQTIYVTAAQPLEPKRLYEAVWVKGVLTIKQEKNELATAAYSMELHELSSYDEL